MEKKIIELHGHWNIPRGVPLIRGIETNESGIPFRTHWHPISGNDGRAVIVAHPHSCYCDPCRGLNDTWDQHIFCNYPYTGREN
ncbi:MAG: hypothetical protein ACXAEU_23505 [Candidatus Hodarchaeales archaeon]